ncbi:MAG: hypothetical protein KKA73_21375 [Chloroflexi bacterium]|nr:hypothetical protein [Chloroflexota bacterium]MBU1750245.1 hypothetical protein [Chloroflexota bacterium]
MSTAQDRALLRRFEPVIRYTRGERFFPMDVDTYVRACSLWVQRPDKEVTCLIPDDELTLDELARPRASGFGTVYFLKFIEPLDIPQLAVHNLQTMGRELIRRDSENVFRAGRGRLARVGYVPRFLDALFSLSLLARGRVPGDTATAAVIEYQRILAAQERYCYYGRVVRDGLNGWVALQYWFFYPFNNWRSGFFGVNDHEADWEMIYVYLSESDDGDVCPEWVAYASHDFSGDDLRRRWDDPELEKVGEHPVIYAGAGSHASYYTRGEYMTEIELSYLAPLIRLLNRLRQVWQRAVPQDQNQPEQPTGRNAPNIFRVPFVDYARGDGLSIGPGQTREWDDLGLLNPTPAWATNYRGLWGLYARDPVSGENAPAGPLYNRDGTERRSWCDPLGWAGLDKQPPPDEIRDRLQERQADMRARCAELTATIAQKSQELVGLGVESAATQGRPHLEKAHAAYRKQITTLSNEVEELRTQLASCEALLEAMDLYDEQIMAGERGPARAHIRRAHHPASDDDLRLRRFAEMWAAISVALMTLGFVVLVAFFRGHLVFGLAAIMSLFIFIESGFRGQLSRLVASVTIGLAVVSALVLLFEFFWLIVVLVVLIAGSYIMWNNLREL